jgi:hypothetical protein
MTLHTASALLLNRNAVTRKVTLPWLAPKTRK